MKTRQSGYSLIELLVCMTLLGGTLLAAWELWDYGVAVGAAAGRSLATPGFRAPASTLRRDVQTAASVAAVEGAGWSSGPLELRRGDGSTVSFRLQRGNLLRSEHRTDGGGSISQRLLTGVSSWRWRLTGPELVELRIARTVAPDPVASAGRRDPARRDAAVTRVETLLLCRRGGAGGASW